MITIDIVSDTICPWCFIGKRRLERALAEKPPHDEVQVNWHPFQLNPEMPRQGMERKAYVDAKFGGPDRAREVYDRIREAGRGEQIAFAFERIERTPSTIDSHRLIRYAGAHDCQDAMVEALFRAVFLDGRDIGDTDVLVAVATAVGLDADASRIYLESDADVAQVRAEDARARAMQIQGVPFFIIDGRYAISGAQEPAAFHSVFERVAEDALSEKG